MARIRFYLVATKSDSTGNVEYHVFDRDSIPKRETSIVARCHSIEDCELVIKALNHWYRETDDGTADDE